MCVLNEGSMQVLANLYQERIYRDTEIKCLRGLIEICVQQAKDIEAQVGRA